MGRRTRNLWLFGGEAFPLGAPGEYSLLDDLWKYDTRSNQWTWIKGSDKTNQLSVYSAYGQPLETNSPGGRSASVSWTDATGNFWLFGGFSNTVMERADFNDLWVLGNFSILPVTFTNVKAYQQNTNIAVEWKVQNEAGVKQYDVEKSSDGTIFTKIAMQVAAGNNMPAINYRWLDANVFTGNNFYRIRSIDQDGKAKYSQVVKVTIGKGNPHYEIYPNPIINGSIQLQFVNQEKGSYQLRLLNSLEQVLQTDQVAHETGSGAEIIQPRRQFAKDNYRVEITAPDKSRQVMKIVY